METKIYKCESCGCLREVGRSLCKSCYLKAKREYAKERYNTRGRWKVKVICKACNKEFNSCRRTSILCPSCYKDSQKTGYKDNSYFYNKRARPIHRVIVESYLKRTLNSNEVIHHMNEDVKDNNLNNIMIMSRHQHGRLHKFLRTQRVIWEKSQNENSVNCWNSLIVSQTTAWLEMTGAKVIKLWELANQQPSSLTGEGSETKHGTPETSNVVGDDIVQTTT